MNAINNFFLRAVLRPTFVYRQLGVDTRQLKHILTAKLMMDDRRPNTFQQTRSEKVKPVSSATIGTMAVSALFGLFLLSSFYVGNDYVTHLTAYFLLYIFMLSSTLIADFTSVLMDVRDNFIILPKPVSDKTFVVARLMHITVHICKLILPMNLPGLIFTGVQTGIWSAIVFFFMAMLVTLFIIFLINALYLIIIRITTPEKFKSVISYVQIFFAVFVFAGYQLAPRLTNKMNLEGFDITANKWAWLLPSYWFAGAWECLTYLKINPGSLTALALSIGVPFISIWLVVKYFAPSFNRKLSMIGGSQEASTPLVKTETGRGRLSLAMWLSDRFTKAGPERMAFKFCWSMTGRSRDFKLKVYPAFGYLLVYFVMMFMGTRSFSVYDISEETVRGRLVIVSLIYFSSFLLMTALSQLAFSDKYKAAWICFTAPISLPGSVITGAVKSAIFKFYLPFILVVSIPAVMVAGIKIVPNLLLGLCNELLICTLLAYITIEYLPFSVQQGNEAKAGNFFKSMLMLIFPGIVGILHYAIYPRLWLVGILCVISLAASWFVLKAVRNKSWNKVLSKYND